MEISDQLAAAQQKLFQRRQAVRPRAAAASSQSTCKPIHQERDHNRLTASHSPFFETAVSSPHQETAVPLSAADAPPVHEPPVSWELKNAQKQLQKLRGTDKQPQPGLTARKNSPETAVASDLQGNRQETAVSGHVGASGEAREPKDPDRTIKLYPDLAVAARKAGQAAVMRLLLLLHDADTNRRGWLEVEAIREATEGKGIMTWRRARQLLQQGRGAFWTYEEERDRYWIHGPARLASSLNLGRLTGRPVQLPYEVLTSGMGDFNATVHAAWLDSRKKKGNPKSQETIEEITGVPARTQRHYCQVASVDRVRNMAIGKPKTNTNIHNEAHKHGRAWFIFVDRKGKQGKPGAVYNAWMLPNSYQGATQLAPMGRQRKTNRKIKDLVKIQARGNDDRSVKKLFYPNGKDAAAKYGRDHSQDVFFPLGETRGKRLWNCLYAF